LNRYDSEESWQSSVGSPFADYYLAQSPIACAILDAVVSQIEARVYSRLRIVARIDLPGMCGRPQPTRTLFAAPRIARNGLRHLLLAPIDGFSASPRIVPPLRYDEF
jgi:hypothetical protein